MGFLGKRRKEQAPRGGAGENARVKVLGTGCASCQKLEANAIEAMVQLGLAPEVGHVTDFAQIAAYGVMRTPGLVVDGQVVASGQVLSSSEVAAILKERLIKEDQNDL